MTSNFSASSILSSLQCSFAWTDTKYDFGRSFGAGDTDQIQSFTQETWAIVSKTGYKAAVVNDRVGRFYNAKIRPSASCPARRFGIKTFRPRSVSVCWKDPLKCRFQVRAMSRRQASKRKAGTPSLSVGTAVLLCPGKQPHSRAEHNYKPPHRRPHTPSTMGQLQRAYLKRPRNSVCKGEK